MHIIKCFFRYILFTIVAIPYTIRCFFIILFWKKRIFILNTPIHGNIGDQAILLAEQKMIKDVLPHHRIIVVPNNICKSFTRAVAKIVGSNAVCLHGGGYLGDLWPDEDDTIRKLLELLRDNKMLFFPQTFCCKEIENYFIKNKKVFEDCGHLVLFARDSFTYDCLRSHLKNKVIFVPDIVLYEKRMNYEKGKQVIVCLRNDIEKTMDGRTEDGIIKSIGKSHSLRRTDMMTDRVVHIFNRRRIVHRKLREIGESQLLITDRLHGMIFAYLTMTPCLMFDSKSPKIRGVYEWIKGSDYIVFHDDSRTVQDEIDEMLKRKYSYNQSISQESFEEIKNELMRMVK